MFHCEKVQEKDRELRYEECEKLVIVNLIKKRKNNIGKNIIKFIFALS